MCENEKERNGKSKKMRDGKKERKKERKGK